MFLVLLGSSEPLAITQVRKVCKFEIDMPNFQVSGQSLREQTLCARTSHGLGRSSMSRNVKALKTHGDFELSHSKGKPRVYSAANVIHAIHRGAAF